MHGASECPDGAGNCRSPSTPVFFSLVFSGLPAPSPRRPHLPRYPQAGTTLTSQRHSRTTSATQTLARPQTDPLSFQCERRKLRSEPNPKPPGGFPRISHTGQRRKLRNRANPKNGHFPPLPPQAHHASPPGITLSIFARPLRPLREPSALGDLCEPLAVFARNFHSRTEIFPSRYQPSGCSPAMASFTLGWRVCGSSRAISRSYSPGGVSAGR